MRGREPAQTNTAIWDCPYCPFTPLDPLRLFAEARLTFDMASGPHRTGRFFLFRFDGARDQAQCAASVFFGGAVCGENERGADKPSSPNGL